MGVRSLDLDIRLTEKQLVMYDRLNDGQWREVLFYGSSRSGKTFLILYWMVVQCIVYRANCLILRNLFTSLQIGMLSQTLPAVLRSIAELNGYRSIDKVVMRDGSPFCKLDRVKNVLRFFNGAYIQFSSIRGSSDRDSAYDKILSSEWGHIFVDEVSEVDERSVDTLRSRLAQRLDVPNKILFALNPTRKSGWTYVRFFKHEDRDGMSIPDRIVERFLVVKFGINDNLENISEDYKASLESMSALQRKRFLEGDYFDESEGEVFRKITWSGSTPAHGLPKNGEWEGLLIYTDPSATDNRNSDYKASVLLGRARGMIWLLGVRAVQGTSRQMMDGIWELYRESPVPEMTRIVMEKKQVPLDFRVTFEKFQESKGWVCPLEWDTRNMGNKFTMIESTLEPLFAYGRFVFNEKLKYESVGEIAINQFLFFSAKEDRTRHDDIPDACAKGTTLLNRNNSISSGGFKNEAVIVKKPKRFIS